MGGKLLRWFAVGLLAGIILGSLAAVVLASFIDLPAVEALTTYQPPAATVVKARDGSVIGSFAAEKRLPVSFEQIPKVFRDAVLAVEDANFYRHPGVDPSGVARAFLRNVLSLSKAQGGSTITQQLARNVGIVSREKKLIRKLKEILLAIEIEQKFSKDQIFTLYANQVNFGHGVYGVEAAARFYFGKSASALTLAEAALLAGLPQRPADLSPLDHPQRALRRRNHVLQRMLEEGMIDRPTYEKAIAEPLGASPHFDRETSAAYFLEEVRRLLESSLGTELLLEGGLTAETTLDPALQQLAEESLREGLVELQKRLGWPGALRNVKEEGIVNLATFRHPSWPYLRWRTGELAYALVLEVSSEHAKLLIGNRQARLELAEARWTKRSSLFSLVKPGDLVLVRLKEVPAPPGTVTVSLEAEPKVEGALVVLDNRTGAILALVGGFDFNRSQFDRAIQAKRQVGSAFKPMVYAAAYEAGYSPADTIFDAPVLLPDEQGLPTYCPLNYYRKYYGMVTLRFAVEHSLNASAVKLQQMVSGERVIDLARRLGVREELRPYPSMALGSFELPVVTTAAAYAAFANGGMAVEPYFLLRVRDSQGKTLLEQRPQVRQALSQQVAYMMTHTLTGVVQRGTAAKAASLPGHLAGKTGTTDAYTDAWFIGYSPRITCAVWVGRDKKEPIGRRMTGAEAALPTWIRFMQAYLQRLPEAIRSEDFPLPPSGVTLIPVDPRTGLRATPDCGDNVILEAVPEDKLPPACSAQAHRIAELPWEQQLRYYTFKPGEPLTTPEAIAVAAAKASEKDQ
ncbi:MAG: PBP1A family penicillin-binding protein [Thermoanaerobaculum sp.]|nr:PBP1A family penicillin-binding protein [Thermoanaerobaculum sp.]